MYREFFRRFRGRIRQSRKILISEVNIQVNLAHDIVKSNLVSADMTQENFSDPFELLMVASSSDLPLALLNIKNMIRLYGSKLIGITVVSQVKPKFEFPSGTRIITDSELLQNPRIIQTLRKFGSRESWMRQQYLKSRIIHESNSPVLILDADTFLVKPISWHSSKKQLLLLNTVDYHTSYTTHASKFFNSVMPALNFVSHVQLQIPSIVSEIYSSNFDSGWIRWAESSMKFGEDSPASEFQTYGGFIVTKYRDRTNLYIPNHALLDCRQIIFENFLQDLELFHSDLVTLGNKKNLQ